MDILKLCWSDNPCDIEIFQFIIVVISPTDEDGHIHFNTVTIPLTLSMFLDQESTSLFNQMHMHSF